MSFLRDIIAATVSASGLSVPVVVTIGELVVHTSGPTGVAEEDRDLLAGHGVAVDRTVRVPVADFAVAPFKGCTAVVDGTVFRVEDAHLRNRVYLLTLKRLATR